jgi:HlyD family secretion protein
MSAVDLDALRMQQPIATKPPRGPRILVATIAIVLLATAATFLWPLLRPVRAVPMAAVRTAAHAAGANATGASVAEAAGWIEPDPYPITVRPLIAGRVERLLVLEGAEVKAGVTVLAQLADAALTAAAERARADVVERQRQRDGARAALVVAERELEQRSELRAAAIEADASLAERRQRLAAAAGAAQRSRADSEAATAAAAAQEQLAAAGGSYPIALSRARAQANAAIAVADAAVAEHAASIADVAAAEQRTKLAGELLANPVTLTGAVELARTALATTEAAVATATAELTIAERELGWTTVLAPADGIVLRLFATVGHHVGPTGEPLLWLYDPQHLRARIDVPLALIAGIHDGQAVELRSEVLGNTVLKGRVQRIQRESDLLKNTLQVKVEVLDPPPLLRPETLCRARFLGDPTRSAAATTAAFLVSRQAIQNGFVFRFDPAAGVARAVAVQVQHEQGDDALVTGELSPAMHVILAPVSDGERVAEVAR